MVPEVCLPIGRVEGTVQGKKTTEGILKALRWFYKSQQLFF